MIVELMGGCLDGALYETPVDELNGFQEFKFPRKTQPFCSFDSQWVDLEEFVWSHCGPGDCNSALVAVYVPDKMRAEGMGTKVWLKFKRYDNI